MSLIRSLRMINREIEPTRGGGDCMARAIL